MKRTEMIADFQDGGQKMLDIIEFNKALNISWILKVAPSTVLTVSTPKKDEELKMNYVIEL